jgi:ABC-type transport system substrate-binding protein
MVAVTQFWRAIGVKCTIQPIDTAASIAITSARKAAGIAANYGRAWKAQDPLYYLNVHLSPSGSLGGCEDPGLEAIRQRAQKETDKAKYADVLREAGKYIYDEFLTVPLVIANLNFGVGRTVDPSWPATEGKIQISGYENIHPKR